MTSEANAIAALRAERARLMGRVREIDASVRDLSRAPTFRSKVLAWAARQGGDWSTADAAKALGSRRAAVSSVVTVGLQRAEIVRVATERAGTTTRGRYRAVRP